MNLKY